ncbi:MAG TPA: carboxypeptidase-like regulatory domain-containing protein, partial [bacterium]
MHKLLTASILAFCVIVVATNAQGQEREITGKVTARETGAPLPNANILIKGTTRGTASDADGNFRLTIPTAGTTLVVSYIGYAS